MRVDREVLARRARENGRYATTSGLRPGKNPLARELTRHKPSGVGIRKTKAARPRNGVWATTSPSYFTEATIDKNWDK